MLSDTEGKELSRTLDTLRFGDPPLANAYAKLLGLVLYPEDVNVFRMPDTDTISIRLADTGVIKLANALDFHAKEIHSLKNENKLLEEKLAIYEAAQELPEEMKEFAQDLLRKLDNVVACLEFIGSSCND